MDMVKLYLDCLLRPILESDVKLIEEDDDDDEEDAEDEDNNEQENEDEVEFQDEGGTSEIDNDLDGSKKSDRKRKAHSIASAWSSSTVMNNVSRKQITDKKKGTKTRRQRRKRPADDMLDLEGPKLWNGAKIWLIFYQIIGQLNITNTPLCVSICYKFLVTLGTIYILNEHFLKRIFQLNIVDENYRNPIFIFISLLALVSTVVHSFIAIYTNLFNLCPMFKIIATPKLCFISNEIQHITGTGNFKLMVFLNIYHALLVSMFVCRNLEEFVHQFRLHTFLVDMFSLVVANYYLVGMAHFDFYIRSSFGFWLIAMKFNLEHRFTFLHKYQRKQRLNELKRLQNNTGVTTTNSSGQRRRSTGAGTVASELRPNSTQSQAHLEHQFRQVYKFVTLDEIQKSLNNMDDHLEVWRTIQTSSLVMITLNAFLTNGALLLLAYNLLANRANYYHGLLLLLISVNFTIIIFMCYIGDSWISYTLSSFVQTVEDEYFLQGGDDIADHRSAPSRPKDSVLPLEWQPRPTQQQQQHQQLQQSRPEGSNITNGQWNEETADSCPIRERFSLARQYQSLLIKKKDVLFCREFLHQFENHLATPWSKLTVKTHLHMLGTFVTLIAAQIIFDHEH